MLVITNRSGWLLELLTELIRNIANFHLGTRFKEINIDRKHSRSFESGLREATIKPCDLQKVKYESLKQFASPISYLF